MEGVEFKQIMSQKNINEIIEVTVEEEERRLDKIIEVILEASKYRIKQIRETIKVMQMREKIQI